MSGGLGEYIDQDTARSIDAGRQAIGVGVRTAQKYLQKVFIAFVVGLLGGIVVMRAWVWPALRTDLLAKGASIIAQTPFDVILLQVKIGLIVGIITALPVLWYYAKRPLTEREIIPEFHVARWKLAVLGLVSLLLAVLGVVYAYFVFFPIMLHFLAGNALSSGLDPMYSIVHWTEFILQMAFSFALAAQLPLIMSGLSYAGIVPYEYFLSKWRHAVVLIFVFGALFSPPDVFTQLMWAFPLLALYAISLYLSKLGTIAYRGRSQMDIAGLLKARWNLVVGAAVLGGGAAYVAFTYHLGVYLNRTVFPMLPASIRPAPLPSLGALSGLDRTVAVAVATVGIGLLAAIVGAAVLLYYVISNLDPEPTTKDAFDLHELSEKGVLAAPPELFEELTEEEAVEAARDAMREDDPDKAQAILDRFDDPHGEHQPAAVPTEEEEAHNPLSSTAAGMVSAFTEEETTEDDIGGYYYDIRFVLDSLRSRAFVLVAIFLATMGSTFGFLYLGGIGMLRANFLSRIPPAVRPSSTTANWPITLHPVEALVFEVKLAAIVAAIITVPFLFFWAYPALEQRGIIRGNRRYITVWGLSLVAGVVIGSAVGYLYVAPAIISWLVYDAMQAGMVISYRVNSFFWLVFLTTAGVGLLADIPMTMLLFHRGGLVSYHTMRRQWRPIVLGIFVFGAVVTPSSLYTMLVIALPMAVAFFLGLAILWVVTLGGRRGGGNVGAKKEAAS